MLPLDPVEIMRIRSEFIEARAQSHKFLENSKRIIQEYHEAVERSQRLLDQSRELRLRVEEVGRRAL